MTKRIDANGFLKQDSSPVYICYHNSRKLAPCDGPTTYRAEKVDAMVDEIVRTIQVVSSQRVLALSVVQFKHNLGIVMIRDVFFENSPTLTGGGATPI